MARAGDTPSLWRREVRRGGLASRGMKAIFWSEVVVVMVSDGWGGEVRWDGCVFFFVFRDGAGFGEAF